MKKITSIVLAAMVVLSMVIVSVSAGAFNAAGNCATSTVVKKADSSAVVKDGKIGDGEYTEIEINRDPLTSDLMVSWNGPAENYDNAQTFMKDVHFYMSWDEVHGLNVAAKVQLLETPVNPCTNGGDPSFAGNEVPGDQFLFQFGMMFRTAYDDQKSTVYRGFSKNTETGELLYGWYADQDGWTGSLNQTAGTDYTVSIDGNWVTYEISFPLETILPAGKISGNAPADGAQFPFDTTVTGGSTGLYTKDCSTYAVSIGDGGFMTSQNAFNELKHGTATFSLEAISSGETEGPGTDGPSTDGPSTDGPKTEPGGTETVVTDDGTTIKTVTNADGSKTVTTIKADGTTTTTTEKAPQTGDPMIIAAAVSAISACGIVVAKKRRG